MRTKKVALDPIIAEVVRNALLTITEEMRSVVTRTATSILIKNAGDLSCGILDTDLELVAGGEGDIPILVSTMPYSLQGAISKISFKDLSPGDLIIHNDPYLGNNHLNDVFIAKPVFFDGKIIAFSAVKGHWQDIGGSTPGSLSASAYDIFAEGLRIPPLKIVEEGEMNSDVLDLILSNTRTPAYRASDIRAQIAGCNRGESKILALTEKYGTETLKLAMEEVLNYSERLTKIGIGALPDGTYSFTDYCEGFRKDDLLKIKAQVKIKGSDCYIDLKGTDKQISRGLNVPLAVTLGACFYAIKSITDPTTPSNSGCFRPIHIAAPLGSLVNPVQPGGVAAGNVDTSSRVADCIFGALAKAAPDRVVAAGTGCTFMTRFSGIDRRPGRHSRVFVQGYGNDVAGGAAANHDGRHGTRSNVGNSGEIPVEVLEVYLPIMLETSELLTDSGGPGKFRGGFALHRRFKALAEITCSVTAERAIVPPYGLFGGRTGQLAKVLINKGTKSEHEAPLRSQAFLISKGETMDVFTASGGGYGDPKERDPELILRDLRNGFITIQGALDDYGYRVNKNV